MSYRARVLEAVLEAAFCCLMVVGLCAAEPRRPAERLMGVLLGALAGIAAARALRALGFGPREAGGPYVATVVAISTLAGVAPIAALWHEAELIEPSAYPDQMRSFFLALSFALAFQVAAIRGIRGAAR